MKNIVCVIGMAGAYFFSGGCGQSPGATETTTSDPGTSAEALNVVDGCVTQAKTCAAAAKSVADGAACEQALRSCLAPLLADAGHVTVPPIVIPDAALPPLPPLPDAAAIEAAVRACVATLGTCLASSSDPMTCADQAVSCIKGAL